MVKQRAGIQTVCVQYVGIQTVCVQYMGIQTEAALVGTSLIGFSSGLCLIHREDTGTYRHCIVYSIVQWDLLKNI